MKCPTCVVLLCVCVVYYIEKMGGEEEYKENYVCVYVCVQY